MRASSETVDRTRRGLTELYNVSVCILDFAL